MSSQGYDDDVEEFIESRAEKIADRLSKLSEKELESYQDFTTKKEIRIAQNLGFPVGEIDEESDIETWRLISRKPEELNAFLFTHIRWYAHFLDYMRREKLKPRNFYYDLDGCYL